MASPNGSSWPFSPLAKPRLERLLYSQKRTAALHNGTFTIDPSQTVGCRRFDSDKDRLGLSPCIKLSEPVVDPV